MLIHYTTALGTYWRSLHYCCPTGGAENTARGPAEYTEELSRVHKTCQPVGGTISWLAPWDNKLILQKIQD